MKNSIHKVMVLVLVLSLAGCASSSSKSDLAEQALEVGFFDQPVEGEITVYLFSPYLKAYFTKTASLFKRVYPGTEVNVEMFSQITMSSEEISQAKSDYLTRLSTEIMSGKGPDIIVIDIPYYNYAESGAFVDMQQYMNSDTSFNILDYRESVLDAIKYKGHQYIFPLNYIFNFVAYDSSFFTEDECKKIEASHKFSYEQLIELGKESFNRTSGSYIFSAGGSLQHPSMFNNVWETNYGILADIHNKEAHFNDGRFTALLKLMPEYVNSGYIPEKIPENELKWQVSGDGKISATDIEANLGISGASDRYLYKVFDSGKLLSYLITVNNDLDMWYYEYGMGNVEDDVIAGVIADNNGNVGFDFSHAAAINANSTNKRMSWEFIKLLSSEEMQCSTELWSTMPVNINAFEKKSKLIMNKKYYNTELAEKSFELTDKQQELFDNYVAWMDKLTSAIDTYTVRAGVVDAMIAEELKNYFDGIKTVDEVAQILQYKVELYLNE